MTNTLMALSTFEQLVVTDVVSLYSDVIHFHLELIKISYDEPYIRTNEF